MSRRRRGLVLAAALASLTLMVVDHGAGADSPVEPVRRLVGEVLGPVEQVSAAVARPVAGVPVWFRTRSSLRHDVATLQAENSRLRQQVAAQDLDRNRLAEYDALTAAAEQSGLTLVPARVVAVGPARTFSRTVTIDAGSRAGLRPDLTVVDGDGLVGRVIRVTRSTATVLLIVDPRSVVGGRLGRSMEVGFVRGRGVLGAEGALDLELVDGAVVPVRGDQVLTWGSGGGAPYVSGVPIGQITQVFTSLRDTSYRAVLQPAVDFTSLDVVGVVVASGTKSDRALVEADGSLR